MVFNIGHWLLNQFFGWPKFGFLVTYGLFNQIIKMWLNNYLSSAYISVCNRCSTTCQSFHIFVFICFNVYNMGSRNCFRWGRGRPTSPWHRYLPLATLTCNRMLQAHWKHLELQDFLTKFLPIPRIWWCDWPGVDSTSKILIPTKCIDSDSTHTGNSFSNPANYFILIQPKLAILITINLFDSDSASIMAISIPTCFNLFVILPTYLSNTL